MATEAQIVANRANARKSTGPRTPEGKERASRNALKHGLLAREAVIRGEDPEEFELYREGMLEDLAPAGPMESMLAERIVGLSWRLRRAERLQNAAFAALDDGTPTPLLDGRLEEWKRLKGSEADRSVSGVFDDNRALAGAVVEDFAEARVLDRLLMYERRIESSLYRSMAELRKERNAREAAAKAEEVSRSESRLQADRKSARPATLASFGANVVAEGGPRTEEVSSVKCEVSSGGASFGTPCEPAETAGRGPAGTYRGTGILPVRGFPKRICSRLGAPVAWARAPMNATDIHGQDARATHGRDGRATHGRDAHATETPDGVTTNELPCETNPMCDGISLDREAETAGADAG